MSYRQFKSYSQDPYWLNARFAGSCCKCGRPIKRGERIFYYPKGKSVFCDAALCGVHESAEFQSAVQDEAFYNRNSSSDECFTEYRESGYGW